MSPKRTWRSYITTPALLNRNPRSSNDTSDDESSAAQQFLLEDEIEQKPKALRFCNRFYKVSRLLHLLLPSFIQPTSIRQSTIRTSELHATSWLDGMRGYACFFVFVYHFVIPFHVRHDYGFGEPVDETKFDPKLVSNFWIMQLPIIRLVHSGQAMVSYFFVISGFVLSHKPIKLSREKQWNRLFSSMTSAVFRRTVRLLTPMVAATAMPMIAIQLGLYELVREYNSGLPRRRPFFEQVWDWISQTSQEMNFLSPSNEIVWNEYGGQTWTILAELKGSFTLFLVVIALCRAKTVARLLVLVSLGFYTVRIGLWETFCFICGIFVAELDHIRQDFTTHDDIEEAKTHKSSVFSVIKWTCVFIFGLFLLSSPNSRQDLTPGYKFLDTLNPLWRDHNRFYHIIGSMVLIFSVDNCVQLQPIFTNCVAQYLGRISFALYLVHFVMVDSLGYAILKITWNIFGSETHFMYELGWCISFVLLAIVVIWVADLFWRGVDLKSVTLSRWLEKKICYAAI